MYLRPQPPPLPLFALRLFPHAQEVQAAEGKEQGAAWKEKKYRQKKERQNQPPAPPRTECRHEMRGRKRRRTSVGVWSGRSPAFVGCVEAVKVSVKCLAVKCVSIKVSVALGERHARQQDERASSAARSEPTRGGNLQSCHTLATLLPQSTREPRQHRSSGGRVKMRCETAVVAETVGATSRATSGGDMRSNTHAT